MALKDNKIKNIVVDIVNYFDGNNVSYVLVGGLAVNIWGRIRTTMDADFIFNQKEIDLEDFVNYLQQKRYEITLND